MGCAAMFDATVRLLAAEPAPSHSSTKSQAIKKFKGIPHSYPASGYSDGKKHKEERDKRRPKHERATATKRDGRGRRESNHPEAENQGCVVSHCGVVSIVAFGLGVMHRVRFICSSDSIETDVIAIAIAVRQVVTRVQDWGIRGSRVCRRFSVGVGGFG
jgi:hypothetical protein